MHMNDDRKSYRIQRSQRTPIADAEETLRTLDEYWNQWFPDRPNYFYRNFPRLLDEPREGETGDALAAYYLELMCQEPGWNELYIDMVYAALISSGYCAEAIRASRQGLSDAAWAFAGDAQYWLGVARGQWGLMKVGGETVSSMARKGADARHEETRKLKAEVLEYWRKNISPSISNEKAADKMRLVFPLAFRTLRDYVAEAKRKNKQSAGTE